MFGTISFSHLINKVQFAISICDSRFSKRSEKEFHLYGVGSTLPSQIHYAARLSAFQPSFHESRELVKRSREIIRESQTPRGSRDSIQCERGDGKVLTRID